jgi:hypothetical protein
VLNDPSRFGSVVRGPGGLLGAPASHGPETASPSDGYTPVIAFVRAGYFLAPAGTWNPGMTRQGTATPRKAASA